MELSQLGYTDWPQMLAALKGSSYGNLNRRTGGSGFTGLHLAARHGQLDIARWMLQAGADVALCDMKFGRSALHWAAIAHQLEIAKVLLSYGADPEAEDTARSTPMDLLRGQEMEAWPESASSVGELCSWGNGANFVLGHGGRELGRAPKRVKALEGDVIDVDACALGAAAVTQAGELWTWGEQALGHDKPLLQEADVLHPQLAQPRTAARPAGSKVKGEDLPTVAVSGATARPDEQQRTSHVVLLPERVPLTRRLVKVALGATHLLALSAEGEVFSCGSGPFGQLGLEASMPVSPSPRLVRTGGIERKTVVSIAAGLHHSAAVTADAELFTWTGALGHAGLLQDQWKPKLVAALRNVAAVAAGQQHSVASCGTRPDLFVFGNSESSPQRLFLPGDERARGFVAADRGITVVLARSGLLFRHALPKPGAPAAAAAGAGAMSSTPPSTSSLLAASAPAPANAPAQAVKPGSAVPLQLPSLPPIVQISAKGEHLTLMDHNGLVYGCSLRDMAHDRNASTLRVWRELRGRAEKLAAGVDCTLVVARRIVLPSASSLEASLPVPSYAPLATPLTVQLLSLLPPVVTGTLRSMGCTLQACDSLSLFQDVTVTVQFEKGQSPPMALHRCLLAARSRVLADLILAAANQGQTCITVDTYGRCPGGETGSQAVALCMAWLYAGQLLWPPSPAPGLLAALRNLAMVLGADTLVAACASWLKHSGAPPDSVSVAALCMEEQRSMRRALEGLVYSGLWSDLEILVRDDSALAEDAAAAASTPVAGLKGSAGLKSSGQSAGGVPPKRLQAHRVLLAARSELFASMLTAGMREARLASVDLSESISARSFAPVLTWLYTDHWAVNPTTAIRAEVEELLAVADHFLLWGLKLAVERVLGGPPLLRLPTLISTLQLAAAHDSQLLSAVCYLHIARFLSAPCLFQPALSQLELPQLRAIRLVVEAQRKGDTEVDDADEKPEESDSGPLNREDWQREVKKLRKKLAQAAALRTRTFDSLSAPEAAKARKMPALEAALQDLLAREPVDEAAAKGAEQGEDNEADQDGDRCAAVEEEEAENGCANDGEAYACDQEGQENTFAAADSEEDLELAAALAESAAEYAAATAAKPPAAAPATGPGRSAATASTGNKQQRGVKVTLTATHNQRSVPAPAPVPAKPAAAPKGWATPKSAAVAVPLTRVMEEQRGPVSLAKPPARPSAPASPAKPASSPTGAAAAVPRSPAQPLALGKSPPLSTMAAKSLVSPKALSTLTAAAPQKASPAAHPPSPNGFPALASRAAATAASSPPSPSSPPASAAIPAHASRVAGSSPPSPSTFPPLASRAAGSAASPSAGAAVTPHNPASMPAFERPRQTLLEIQNEELRRRAMRTEKATPLSQVLQQELERKQKLEENWRRLELEQAVWLAENKGMPPIFEEEATTGPAARTSSGRQGGHQQGRPRGKPHRGKDAGVRVKRG